MLEVRVPVLALRQFTQQFSPRSSPRKNPCKGREAVRLRASLSLRARSVVCRLFSLNRSWFSLDTAVEFFMLSCSCCT